MTKEDIARIAHNVNAAYCTGIGDDTQVVWDSALQWQKESAIKGVEFRLNNPDNTAEDQHKEWRNEKEMTGWKYGPVKDATKKEHPCIVDYVDLPTEQRVKDYLFQAVVDSLKQYLD